MNTYHNRKGVALVMVLALLVLLSAIVVAFLSSVTTDLAASKSYEGQTNARQLADSAVNLVISQIRKASTQSDQTWISQPGLVRTYDTSGASGAYKLYSAAQIYETGEFDPAEGTDLPPDDTWSTNAKGLWTDMNSPIFRVDPQTGTSRPVYPIFDVNPAEMASDGTIDADGDKMPDVEGFKIEDYTSRLNPSNSANTGFMPVQWLYMLQDGTLVPAEAAGTNEVTIGGSVSATNPVVARLAFWTDDETCKININTASEGAFWDTPVANSQPLTPNNAQVKQVYEYDLGMYLPASREYQRYPGHPATTSLSPVFGRALMKKLGIDPNAPTIPKAKWVQFTEAIYQMTPRVSGKSVTGTDVSSQGGTKRAGSGPNGQNQNDQSVTAVATDADRLFATPDELFFDTKRVRQSGLSSGDVRALIEKSKFFLTATSKAPEQNAYNKPRVSIWPITVNSLSNPFDESKMTYFDKLISFCSTVGSERAEGGKRVPFYFVRKNPNSMTEDWNSSNESIFNYLKAMCGKAAPNVKGGTKSLSDKYSEIQQILIEMFDYVRCTNLIDTSDDKPGIPPTASKSYTLPDALSGLSGGIGGRAHRGQVLPIAPFSVNARGFGRVVTLSEMALVVIRDQRAPAGKAKIQVALMPNFYCPMAGYSALANDIGLRFKQIDVKVKLNKDTTVSFGAPPYADALWEMGRFSSQQSDESKLGGSIGMKTFVEAIQNDGQGAPANSRFPVAEAIIDQPGENDTLTIEGGDVIVEFVYPGGAVANKGQGGTVIQSIRMRFPPVPPLRFPIPSAGFPSATNPTKVGSRIGYGRGWFPIYANPPLQPPKPQQYYDIVRSLVASGGNVNFDMRVVACLGGINLKESELLGNPVFVPHPDYNVVTGSNANYAFSIMGTVPGRGTVIGSKIGSLTKQTIVAPENTWRPYVAAGIQGVQNVDNPLPNVGDWDNGPHFLMDGSYLGKADEGTGGHTHFGEGQKADSAAYIGWNYVGEDAGMEQLTFFSPNRQISSPVAFGSLPTGVLPDHKGWQTLLFRPSTPGMLGMNGGADVTPNHPGAKDPPDHRFLDLFWMPVVEPYAISEPFATAGKINMNYQIAPFTYIKRQTALIGAMKAVKVTAINPTQASYSMFYKNMGYRPNGGNDSNSGGAGIVLRRNIDAASTLQFFEEGHFKQGENKPFLTESEICTIPLIPADMPSTGAGVYANAGIKPTDPIGTMRNKLSTFWNGNNSSGAVGNWLTGDNSLERPYSLLYPRLTTKSNTYTVHVKVQTLKKVPVGIAPANSFKEERDQVTGEFRGSFVIERYLDPNLQTFDITDQNAVLGPYKFRVVNSKQFVQ
jgi:uncharacterized protein (TIGR02600 family)